MFDKLQFVDLGWYDDKLKFVDLGWYDDKLQFVDLGWHDDKLQFVDLGVRRQTEVCRTLIYDTAPGPICLTHLSPSQIMPAKPEI